MNSDTSQIGNVFSSLTGEAEEVLPESYLQLKRSIIGDEANQTALKRSWASLSKRLAFLADHIERQQQAVSNRRFPRESTSLTRV